MSLPKSTQKLIDALKASSYLHLGEIIKKAENNCYHEFLSDDATPITNLVKDLLAVGCKDLAQRAADGEFDATKTEANEWFEQEGQDILKTFVKG